MAKKSGFNTIVPTNKLKDGNVIFQPKEIKHETAWDYETSNGVWSATPECEIGFINKIDGNKTATFAIKTDGSLWGWSNDINESGTYYAPFSGLGIFGDNVKAPVKKVFDSCGWKHVSAGWRHNVGVKEDGSLWSWGYLRNYAGGTGAYNCSDTTKLICNISLLRSPVQTFAPTCDWKTATAGVDMTFAVKCDGSLWSWGRGTHGATFETRSVPTQIVVSALVDTFANTEVITNTLLGRASLTMDDTIDYIGDYDYPDSGFWDVILPWSVSFGGDSYDRAIISTDSYLLLSKTSNTTPFDGTLEDYSFSATMFPLPKIYIGSVDASAERIFYGEEGTAPNRTFRIRFEGYVGYSGGDDDFPDKAWEITFYEAIPERIDIQIDPAMDIAGKAMDITSSSFVYTTITDRGFRINSVGTIGDVVEPTFRAAHTWSDTNAAITNDGKLIMWGCNFGGLLGRDQSFCSLPRSYEFLETAAGGCNWKQFSFARPTYRNCLLPNFAAAVKTDGTLWTWGHNLQWNLGDGTSISRSSPVQTATGGTDWKKVSVSPNANKALKCDGSIWAWGVNTCGSLGYEPNIMVEKGVTEIATSPIPVKSTANTVWADIATATCLNSYTTRQPPDSSDIFTHPKNFAVTCDGKLYSWGSNCSQGLGHATNYGSSISSYCNYDRIKMSYLSSGWANTNLTDSYGIMIPKSAVASAGCVGGYATAAIKCDGTLWTWGVNSFVNLVGTASAASIFSSPVQTATGGTGWKSLNGTLSSFAAIKDDGSFWWWGCRCFELGCATSPTQAFAGNCWMQVSLAGGRRMALIRSDRTLWITGSSCYGARGNDTTVNVPFSSPTQTVAGGTNWKQVSASFDKFTIDIGTVLATKTDGTLWGWGSNRGGLGDGTTIHRSSPVQTFTGGTDWKSAHTNIGFSSSPLSLGLKNDGSIWAWGTAWKGNRIAFYSCCCPLLGIAGNQNCWQHLFVPTYSKGFPVHAINSKGEHWFWGEFIGDSPAGSCFFQYSGYDRTLLVCEPTRTRKICGSRYGWSQVGQNVGIKSDGKMFVWGCNAGKRLTYPKEGPCWVSSNEELEQTCKLLDFTDIFVQKEQLTRSGVWGSGWNCTEGRFGIGMCDYITCITQLDPSFCWNGISAYGRAVLATKCDGTLWGWGANWYGKLGVNNFWDRKDQITQVGTSCEWAKAAIGFGASQGIKKDGTLWSWGTWCRGRNGLNTNEDIFVPTILDAGCWLDVTSDYYGSQALKSDGTLWRWGKGYTGTNGDNTTITRSSPVQTIAGGTNWCAIGGTRTKAAIKTDGTLWLSGTNQYGQIGNNTVNSTGVSSPVQTVAGGTNWSKVAGHWSAMTAVKADGTLWSWGRNDRGELGDGTFISKSSPVQTVSGGTAWRCVLQGFTNSFAIKNDGTLWAWGYNTFNNNYTAFGVCQGVCWINSPVQVANNIKGFWKCGSGGMYGTFIGLFESEADDI